MILAITAAFVAGMLVSAPQVFAPGQGQGDTLVTAAIDALTTAVGGTSTGDTLVADAIAGIPFIAGPQGTQGETGLQGEQGPKGDNGVDGVVSTYQKYQHFGGLNPSGDTMEMNCEPGDFVTGAAAGPLGGEITFESPLPVFGASGTAPATGWRFGTEGSSGMDMTLVCMDVP